MIYRQTVDKMSLFKPWKLNIVRDTSFHMSELDSMEFTHNIEVRVVLCFCLHLLTHMSFTDTATELKSNLSAQKGISEGIRN